MRSIVGILVSGMLTAGCGHSRPKTTQPAVRAELAAAEAAERRRQHEQARAHYLAAIAQATTPPGVVLARRAFAETLISWGEYPEAIIQLEGVVAAAPTDAAAWHDLGLLLHNRGDDQRAIAALERSRELAPGDFRPRVSLGALRWKRGDRVGARAEYEALLGLELPAALRRKVTWAIATLSAKPAR
jgi:Flp pilus assembly protein TadD